MNFVGQVDWVSLGAFVTVVAALLGGMFWLVRQGMRSNFVSHAEHQQLGTRIAGVEGKLGGMATKIDVDHLEQRLRPVEAGVQVLGEQVRSVAAGVARTEHMVSMLIEANLRQAKATDE